MKLLIKTVFFHIFCIILFTLIYVHSYDHFENITDKKYNTNMDFLLLSTTIQSGVGLTDLLPTSNYAKIMVILQQLLRIFTHVITIYIFTL